MFRKIVGRYCRRIASLPADKVKIWQTFPVRGWILLDPTLPDRQSFAAEKNICECRI